MGLGAVIYLPSFIKIGSGVQKLMGGDTQTRTQTHTHTRTATWSHKPILFFQDKQSRLKRTRMVGLKKANTQYDETKQVITQLLCNFLGDLGKYERIISRYA
jgi:hypothetical protein